MSLVPILNASSVAIIGASKVETKRGFQAIRTLLQEKYEGKIYPVNPKETNILGLKCYPSINDIENPVELALITTPAKTVPSVLEDCGKKGVKGVVIIAGGFRETGKEGKKLEENILNVARKHNIRLIGPNTSGMMNLNANLNLVGLRDAPKGDIALVSQSGNMALSIITEAKLKSKQGFSYYIGIGNEVDVRFHEYLEFFRDDPNTKAILLYVEGMRDGRRFLQQAYKTTELKPVILLKGGRSAVGKKSAGSHTGALAGFSEVSRTAFKRAGIIVIENPDELFPAAETLASLPPIKNNHVAILADGGGHATIGADILSDFDVQLPELHPDTQKKLRKILPPAAAVHNPVDVAGGTDSDPTVFAECADIILKDPSVGGLLIVGLFGGYGIRFAETLRFNEEDAAHQMGKMVKHRKKPIVVHSLYESERPHSLNLLRYYGIPVYGSLDVACKCIGVLAEYGSFQKSYHAKANFVFDWYCAAKKECQKIIDHAKKDGRNVLTEYEAKQLLRKQGLPVVVDKLVQTADEAVEFWNKTGSKIAMKIVSPDILHKSDAGCVKLDLDTEHKIRQAFNKIMTNANQFKPDADIKGILVSPMADEGVEVIIGTKIDDQFGPVILFGLGGVMVELLKDISTRVLPISDRSARKMIRDIRAYPILEGVRGTQKRDVKALKDLLLKVSELIESYPEIHEMDLNPVIVHDKGVTIVDARMILGESLVNGNSI